MMHKFYPGDLIYGNEDIPFEREYGLGIILDIKDSRYYIHWINNGKYERYEFPFVEDEHRLVTDIFRGEINGND